jgi:hypothetical protein
VFAYDGLDDDLLGLALTLLQFFGGRCSKGRRNPPLVLGLFQFRPVTFGARHGDLSGPEDGAIQFRQGFRHAVYI